MVRSVSFTQTFAAPDWGNYYQPQPFSASSGDPLRVVLFGSTLGGMWVLEALKKLQQQYGEDRIQLVGLATDDARSPAARISLKKRIWRYFPMEMRMKMVNGIIEKATNASMEVFTGNIKSEFFTELLWKWKPDLIIMACFGQVVPAAVFTYPRLGMYNFHPSDLKNGIGVGPKPFEHTLSNSMSHTCVSVMEVTDVIDHGPMVGYSPLICITGPHGEFFDNVLITEEKVTSVFPYLTQALVKNIWMMQETGKPVGHLTIDLETEIESGVQERLLEAVSGFHESNYPFPDPQAFDFAHPLTHPIQT